MSDDYWDALGLVRTEELLAADEYYGVQQFFARVTDYGFSKTREEALEQWGHDRVLYDDCVGSSAWVRRPWWLLRYLWVGNSDGHGHHMVAGQMAQEVYKVRLP